MPRYQVEELYGEKVLAGQTVEVDEALTAAERVAGAPISPRAHQEHWFRVVDEEQNTVFEFSLAETATRDFSSVNNSRMNDPDCRAALQLIRAAIEEHCPPGVLMSEDEVNGHYGPELLAEAEALSRAIVLTVERLSIGDAAKPPASSIKT